MKARSLNLYLGITVASTFASALAETNLETRIDFGDSQILGQSNDAGAIYLSHRKQNELTSLLSVRLHYRDEILSTFAWGEIDPKTGLPIEPVPFVEGEQVIEPDKQEGEQE